MEPREPESSVGSLCDDVQSDFDQRDAGPTDADPAAAGLTETDDLRRQLERATDQWRRSAADLDNLQKRLQRELARGRDDERERALRPWLQILDDLDRALAHGPAEPDAFAEGIEAIVAQAGEIMAAAGYPRFGNVGDRFDPALHEVTTTVPVTESTTAHEIVAIIRPGYGAPGRMLRAASVVVAADPE